MISLAAIAYLVIVSNENLFVVMGFMLIPLGIFQFIPNEKYVIVDEKVEIQENTLLPLYYIAYMASFLYLLQTEFGLMMFIACFMPFMFTFHLKPSYLLILVPVPLITMQESYTVIGLVLSIAHTVLLISYASIVNNSFKFNPMLLQKVTPSISLFQLMLSSVYFVLFQPEISNISILASLSGLTLVWFYNQFQCLKENIMHFTVYHLMSLLPVYVYLIPLSLYSLCVIPTVLLLGFAYTQAYKRWNVPSSTAVVAFLVILIVWSPPIYIEDPLTTEIARQSDRHLCFKRIHQSYKNTLKSFLREKSDAVYLGTVDHQNLGDSFIWHAEEQMMNELGVNIVYSCHTSKCSQNEINKKLNNKGIILTRGGGNWGDLWRFEQDMRLEYIAANPKSQIIVLPQSIHYDNPELIASDVHDFENHKDLHLMVRSRKSFNILSAFKNNKYLMPDSALTIGPIEPLCEPSLDMVYLKRSDSESLGGNLTAAEELFLQNDITYDVVDWFDVASLESKSNKFFTKETQSDIRKPIYRLHLANRLFCKYKVILTDRLHATVLGLLMDKPVVALENSYGKIRGVTELMEHFGGQECNVDIVRRYLTPNQNMTLAVQQVKHYLNELSRQ